MMLDWFAAKMDDAAYRAIDPYHSGPGHKIYLDPGVKASHPSHIETPFPSVPALSSSMQSKPAVSPQSVRVSLKRAISSLVEKFLVGGPGMEA